MSKLSRRHFLETASVAAAATALPAGVVFARANAKYVRYNATSAEGKAMLQSLADAVNAMLDLKPSDPQNWIRNAFIHTMDCPHGNWWFFPWHRGFTGWFEQIVRKMSKNPNFAFPYWDWSARPVIPDTMFDGVLTPTDERFARYTKNAQTFKDAFYEPVNKSWEAFTPAQKDQLAKRGWKEPDAMWKQVFGNPMFAETQNARYLTRQNPRLDDKTAAMCTRENVCKGLAPTVFDVFGSGKAPSHNSQPGTARSGILEGEPHNNVHNYVGGYIGQKQPPPEFGFMQDNLSPVDPLFVLHHSNMDRLYEAWIKKQRAQGLSPVPTGADFEPWASEPFLFYLGPDGLPVTKTKCIDYATTALFDYEYKEDTPFDCVKAKSQRLLMARVQGKVGANGIASLAMPAASANADNIVAEVTLPHPDGPRAPRRFDVLVNAPPGTTDVGVDSPYYGGTIAFFGYMSGMEGMPTTFSVPIGRTLGALKATKGLTASTLNISVVATVEGKAVPTNVQAVTLRED